MTIKELEKETPPPGSYSAILLGCTCGILDNNYGEGVYTDEQSGFTMYYINSACPLHGDIFGKTIMSS